MKKQSWWKALCAAAACVGSICSAQAAVVTYSEAVSDSLSATGALTTFTLDIGINTVSGQIADSNPDDLDSFAFVIPTGAELVSGQVQLIDFLEDVTKAIWQLRSGSANAGNGALIDTLSPASPGTSPGTDTIAAAVLPLAAGTYNFTNTDVKGNGGPKRTADYTFTLTLRPATVALTNGVPEPTTLALLSLGLAGLAATRRRKQ
jgi:hypothetical protein